MERGGETQERAMRLSDRTAIDMRWTVIGPLPLSLHALVLQCTTLPCSQPSALTLCSHTADMYVDQAPLRSSFLSTAELQTLRTRLH